jgi:hypothetical protein
MTKPKVAFLIRGHIRNSLEDSKLNNFLLSCQDIIDFDLYIQTWNEKEASKSWRDSKIEKLSVNDRQVLSYFDNSLKSKIKNLLVLDDSKLELHGNLEGKIGKSQCPTIGWKYMWSGMYQNISQVSGDYDFAINTRLDILNDHLDNFCRRPRHKKWRTPLSHLDFIKNMVFLKNEGVLNSTYSLYEKLGCDNFFCSPLSDMKFIIKSFHFNLDQILNQWTASNFHLNNQEACFKFFCQNNKGFEFTFKKAL